MIGMADTLVAADPAYEGVISYLLGRIFVVDHIDHAVRLAREFHYSLNIVTLEGEHLMPGGSISGGAFKNSSNLLGRKRELEELQTTVKQLDAQRSRLQDKMKELTNRQELLRKEQEENKSVGQQAYLEQNTAKINLDRVMEQKYESQRAAQSLAAQTKELEQQKEQLHAECAKVAAQLEEVTAKEQQINDGSSAAQKELDTHLNAEQEAAEELSQIQMEEANVSQQAGFIDENIKRLDTELDKLRGELLQLEGGAHSADLDVQEKERTIERLKQEIEEAASGNTQYEKELEERLKQKETMSAQQKGFLKGARSFRNEKAYWTRKSSA